MRVLMVGGTGNISGAVTQRLVEEGHDVWLLTRKSTPDPSLNRVHVVHADVSDEVGVRAALGDRTFDVVVNWVLFTSEQAARDVKLFSRCTHQYVFVSSASAYQKPPREYLVTEATPLDNPYWQYSRDKAACEALFLEAHRDSFFPVTIVRPSLTYGDAVIPYILGSWSHPWSLIDRLLRGRPVIVPGDGTSLWTMTHNTDFAAGFTGLLGNPKALGEAFHITSDEVLTWNEILRQIAAAVGVEPRTVHIPSDTIVKALPDQRGNLFGDKMHSMVFDNSKIKRFVRGYRAKVTFQEGINWTVANLSAHPELQTVDSDHERRMDALVEQYFRLR